MAIGLAPGAVIMPTAAANTSEQCRFDSRHLPAISGMTLSGVHKNIVWAHNGSGHKPRLYALDTRTCAIRAVLKIRGIAAVDTEAIAAGTRADGTPVLWWGDIGDKAWKRAHIAVHEIPEPTELANATIRPTSYRVRLPQAGDAEALLADGDRLWVIGRSAMAGTIWKLPRPLRAGGTSHAKGVGAEGSLVTDAAFRPGGGYAVRDYTQVRIYDGRPPGRLVARLELPAQAQGEAMTWTADGRSLLLAGQGDDRLLIVPVNGTSAKAATASTTARTSSISVNADPVGASPSAAALARAFEPVDRMGTLAVTALWIAAVVLVASTVFVIGLVMSGSGNRSSNPQ
jgi:hypothetical protein